jgi:ferritin-like protein
MNMDIEDRLLAGNRRAFLQQAGALTVGAAAAGLIASRPAIAAAPKFRSDIGVIQTALALEHEGIAAYRLAGKSGLLSKGTLQVATIFMGHHEAHRDSLAKLVRQAGSKPVEPKSDAQYVAELNLASLKSEKDVVALATTLEHGAASAYICQINAIKDPKLANLFASISADEALHWTALNAAGGGQIPKSAYVFA